MNTFGKLFTLTTFGESHGPGIGCVIDGCPAGLEIDLDFIQSELDRRRPGQSRLTTQRKESDTVRILSGVFEGLSTGTPIALFIPNKDARSRDYDTFAKTFRPSHADYTYQAKYGIRDYRGGGRSSARETANWVAAGAIAKLFLKKYGIESKAYVSQAGPIQLSRPYTELDLNLTDTNPVRCPDPEVATRMMDLIGEVRKAGDTVGGVVSGVIQGCPAGLGEPVFNKLHAALGKAMLSINACKGFEYGSGFAGAQMRGSAHNDSFLLKDEKVQTKTNHSGGIQGGISNGMDIYFRCAFKPVATIAVSQQSVNEAGEAVEVVGKGRHDPCVVPRAVPIVEALTAMVLVDFHLLNKAHNL